MPCLSQALSRIKVYTAPLGIDVVITKNILLSSSDSSVFIYSVHCLLLCSCVCIHELPYIYIYVCVCGAQCGMCSVCGVCAVCVVQWVAVGVQCVRRAVHSVVVCA